MTVGQLKRRLMEYPDDFEVMSRDCVAYRELSGPYTTEITKQDCDDHGDCEGREGEVIVVL